MRLLGFLLLILICDQGNGITYKCNTKSSCGCSSSSTVTSRIIGGESAEQGSWSWTVSIRYYGSHFCGGTIISPSFILTAAHCATIMNDLSVITVLAGSLLLYPSSSNKLYEIHSIDQVHIHPKYNSSIYTNDLSLIHLSTPLNMTNRNIKLICLPNGTFPQPPDNINMIAVGWGETTWGDQTLPSILRQVTIQSMGLTTGNCSSSIYNKEQQFCAGLTEGGKDTCQGDSGGPLMAFINGLWQIQGITSYGTGCALPGYPGIYTRLSYYVTWIKSIIDISTTTTRTSTTTTTTRTPTTRTPTTRTPTTTATTRTPTTTTTNNNKPITIGTTSRSTTTTNNKPITIGTTHIYTTTTTRKLTATTKSNKKARSLRTLISISLSPRVSYLTDNSTNKKDFSDSFRDRSSSARNSNVQSLFVPFFLTIAFTTNAFIFN